MWFRVVTVRRSLELTANNTHHDDSLRIKGITQPTCLGQHQPHTKHSGKVTKHNVESGFRCCRVVVQQSQHVVQC